MNGIVFLLIITLFYVLLFVWSFKYLSQERWQMLVAIPQYKISETEWNGLNLTYYGLFNAFAYSIAVFMFIFLMSSIGINFSNMLIVIISLLIICIPASNLLAFLIEGNKYNFTVGGASFIGIILSPIILYFFNNIGLEYLRLPFIETLAAIAIAYAYGEGTGRLACISFGCCYGKLIEESSPIIKKFFKRWYFVFYGKTKKIAYASGMDGKKVIPIQALTSIVNISVAIIGTFLFLSSHMIVTLLGVIFVTQLWRFISEFLRADYRGNYYISVYQKMALISIIYISIITLCYADYHSVFMPDISIAFQMLWDPKIILLLQSIWLITFFYTGKSSVTASSIKFYVNENSI